VVIVCLADSSDLSHPLVEQNYTQNIDTLETVVGVQNVLQCHGSFASASCLQCHGRVPGNVIEREIMQGEVPLCKGCGDSEKTSSKATKRYGKKPDSDDEDDESPFPPWIMKVITFLISKS
jgi:NAD-dependent SIR2 family protein deacetylase